MWNFLKYFIFLPLVLATLVLTSWAYGRQFLDKEQLESGMARGMDTALHTANNYGAPVITPFRKLFQPVLGLFFKQDYTHEITTITADEMEKLIELARTKNYKAVVIYIYGMGCSNCGINYDDINKIAGSFDKKQLIVLALAVETTPEQLSDHFNVSGGLPNFKPLILKPGEEAKIGGISYLMDAAYTKPPYVGVIDQNGRLYKLPYGFGRGEAIVTKLYEFVK